MPTGSIPTRSSGCRSARASRTCARPTSPRRRSYHPDRYANAELPEEVKRYLEDMARRVNAAFSALEEPHQQGRQNTVQRLAPVYSSPAR